MCPMKKRKVTMLTPRQYAAEHGVAYTTVMNWLRNGLITGADKEKLPFGNGYYWQIPKGAPKPVLKAGPKAATNGNGKKKGARR